MRYAGHPLKIGLDGMVPSADIQTTSCCPDPLCLNTCEVICSFIDILPTGPMWDRPKMEAMAYYNGSGTKPCEPACPPPFPCPSLVLHAIYSAMKLRFLVNSVLWPSIRESDPNTATTTIDDWLDRLEWEDCYATHCRSVLLGDITPYEIEGVCGPIYCPPNLPPELECAVKRGILIALSRAQRGVIRNLAGINWIIAPLGAQITPRPVDPSSPCFGKPECCNPEFNISDIDGTIDSCQTGDPTCGPASVTIVKIPSSHEQGCDAPAGLPQVIFPGVIAAECIVRSLMPRACPNIIFSSC